MESSPDDIKEVIRVKLREYEVSEEIITNFFRKKPELGTSLYVVIVGMRVCANLPESALSFDKQRRRKWKRDYIKQIRSLLTIVKDDSLISRIGLSRGNLSREITGLWDKFEQIENGRASANRLLITTASYILVALRGIGLSQTQVVDFVYELLKDTETFKGYGSQYAEQAKDRIRKWDEEALQIIRGHSIKSN
ncbi:hypothetical protein ACFL45_09565 [Candidatus Neomarinimicrobiota bacterium]